MQFEPSACYNVTSRPGTMATEIFHDHDDFRQRQAWPFQALIWSNMKNATSHDYKEKIKAACIAGDLEFLKKEAEKNLPLKMNGIIGRVMGSVFKNKAAERAFQAGFVFACINGHTEVVRFFIESFYSRSILDKKDIQSGFNHACINNQLELISSLISGFDGALKIKLDMMSPEPMAVLKLPTNTMRGKSAPPIVLHEEPFVPIITRVIFGDTKGAEKMLGLLKTKEDKSAALKCIFMWGCSVGDCSFLDFATRSASALGLNPPTVKNEHFATAALLRNRDVFLYLLENSPESVSNPSNIISILRNNRKIEPSFSAICIQMAYENYEKNHLGETAA